jgi:hypothetical protein
LRILKTSKRLTVAAGPKQHSDLVVVAEEGDEQLITPILEVEACSRPVNDVVMNGNRGNTSSMQRLARFENRQKVEMSSSGGPQFTRSCRRSPTKNWRVTLRPSGLRSSIFPRIATNGQVIDSSWAISHAAIF